MRIRPITVLIPLLISSVVLGLIIHDILRSRVVVTPAVVIRSPEDIKNVWHKGVEDVLKSYEVTHDATVARDALVTLVVRTEDRSTHLALVLAFQASIDHRQDAPQKLVEAQQAFTRNIP